MAVDDVAITGDLVALTTPHLLTTQGLRGIVTRVPTAATTAPPAAVGIADSVEETAGTGVPVEEATGDTADTGVVQEVPPVPLAIRHMAFALHMVVAH